jgi:hypothetical protein
MLTGQNSFAIAESVNKKKVMQTLVNATKALKKISIQGKKVHITTYKDFCKEEIKILTSQNSK